jgi:hypothetical protein
MEGLWLYHLVCISLLGTVKGKVSSETLGRIYENGPLEVATSIRSERVSLNYLLDVDDTTKSTAFGTIRLIGDEWKTLKLLESQSLKKEFFEKLESGIEDFAAAGANLNHAKSFLSGNVISNASKCVFEGNVLSKRTIIAEPEFLKSKFDRIGKTWVENDFTTDPSKYTTLYTFIETFNSIAHNWREISDQMCTRKPCHKNDICHHIYSVFEK